MSWPLPCLLSMPPCSLPLLSVERVAPCSLPVPWCRYRDMTSCCPHPAGPPRPCACCRSLGQNFLVDDSILQAVTQAAGIKPGDLVLEVRLPAQEHGMQAHMACMQGMS